MQEYWQGEIPEIDLASTKISILEQNGYALIGYFVLPEHCWLGHYYLPMQASFEAFLNRNGNSDAAQAVVAMEAQEIALYQKYKSHVTAQPKHPERSRGSVLRHCPHCVGPALRMLPRRSRRMAE